VAGYGRKRRVTDRPESRQCQVTEPLVDTDLPCSRAIVAAAAPDVNGAGEAQCRF